MAEPEPKLSIDAWLAELEAATKQNPEGMTARELQDYLKRGPDQVMRLLKVAKARGVLRTARANREAIDGIMRPIPVYWFAPAAKGKAKK